MSSVTSDAQCKRTLTVVFSTLTAIFVVMVVAARMIAY